ncbi:zinc finger BED domain-containing 1-like protein [Labeo rohita]|uniref:Zinc finger BED domain-containing 1-like protein n=1 Tax=Labeo rohita TaxID=84645 RepID=A0A498NWL9_LABRO|nr:zinc finger BED domain-containing 1-like protein [Labeo rohita]
MEDEVREKLRSGIYIIKRKKVDEAERVKRKRDEFSEWEDDSEDVAERDEVQCYIEGQFFWDGEDILSFWQSQSIAFPVLAKVSKMILCIPATSASSERTFSTAGRVLESRRNRLNPVDEAERVKRKRDEFSEWEDDSEDVAERDEVQCYIEGQFFWDGEDILSFWQSQSIAFPVLAKVSKMILCIPATSASSERTFSTAGRVLESRRNRLNPGTVDAILFFAQ